MNLTPVRRLAVFYEPEEDAPIKVGRLATKDGAILFEYDGEFLNRGLELSPFKLPLAPGVAEGRRDVFDGLMGVFEDSLPDGWGRLLIDRRAARAGLPPSALGPLDRLALVGARAMGALVYEPEVALEPPSVVRLADIEADAEAVLADAAGPDLDRLIALGGSPQGARPKALVQVGRDGSVVFGDRRHRAGCTPYLVKFRSRDDEPHAGTLEHAYMLMAAAAGLEVPPTRMLGRTRRHPGYFAIERFDRVGRTKLHQHTAAGLLHAPHWYPSMTYRDLLLATRRLTRNEAAVAELFRRACFNVFAHNRDDHTRNFAFLMDARGGWRPSPAYDLTFSRGPGGEHAMLIGDGVEPGLADLRALADQLELRRTGSIIEQVRAAIDEFARHADEAGLPARVRDRVAAVIAPRRAPAKTKAKRR